MVIYSVKDGVGALSAWRTRYDGGVTAIPVVQQDKVHLQIVM
jgi:hypothetical protein